MAQIEDAALEYQLKRWMRHDAHRYIRPDWRRFVRPGSELAAIYERYERKYRPDQLRDEIGRWADEGGGVTEENENDQLPPNAKPVQFVASNAAPNHSVDVEEEKVDVEEISQKAKQLAATGYSSKYLRCLDLCYPLLERVQPKGADINEWAYRRCIAACLGK